MLTDEIIFYAKAGDGGDGVERWRREKYVPKGGPAGGNGGDGGDVYARAVRDISILACYKHKDKFMAEDGENGRGRSQYGRRGKNLYIDLSVGSIIKNKDTGEESQLLNEGEVVKLLSGGRGGYGNEHFKSSENTAPTDTTQGQEGEDANFKIELMLVVDAGFVGFPNAGKSTLLNEFTRAKAQVGDYQFTTLEPHLGELYGFILADIPGLIKGASDGKGLGHKFLRHIERTRLLIHCISLENEDLRETYWAIREEMRNFDPALLNKPEIIVLTKRDVLKDERESEKAKKVFEPSQEVFAVSILDENSIKELRDSIIQKLERREIGRSITE